MKGLRSQIRGHHIADLDPLGISSADLDDKTPPELLYNHYSFGTYLCLLVYCESPLCILAVGPPSFILFALTRTPFTPHSINYDAKFFLILLCESSSNHGRTRVKNLSVLEKFENG